MDRTQTIEPLYSFDYIFESLRETGVIFKNLNIEIIPPQRAPHIVESNIEFTRGQDNTYTASLAQLTVRMIFLLPSMHMRKLRSWIKCREV